VCSQSRRNRSDSHEPNQLSEKRLIVRNVADRCEPQQTAIVGSTGSELPPSSPGKTTIEERSGAESGALRPEAEAAGGLDPALALVLRRWPTLAAEQRLAVLEIIATGVALEPEPGAPRVASR
jgi:hypothetical protein